MDQQYIPEVWGDEFWQAVQELADNIRETMEQLGKALREAFTPVTESPEKPRQKLPRLARSDCRKMRR